MSNEDYKKVVDRYNELNLEQEKLKKSRKELEILKDEKGFFESKWEVRRYLKILEDIKEKEQFLSNKKTLTEKSIITKVTKEIKDISDINNIYVCLGFIRSGFAALDDEFFEYGKYVEDYDLKTYANIEISDVFKHISIAKKNVDCFENENIVLFSPNGNACSFCEDVRYEFYKNVILYGPEKATEMIINKYDPEQKNKLKRVLVK